MIHAVKRVLKRALAMTMALVTFTGASMSALADEPAEYTVGPDTEVTGIPPEETVGKSYPFPGSIVLQDEDENILPMPRTYPAITEGPMWDNPGGRAHYLFVTFNGATAYCVEPFAHRTTGTIDYLKKTDFDGLDDDKKKAISYLIKFGSPRGNDPAYNAWHVATQCLIWEVAAGERKPDMTGNPGVYYNALVKVFPGMTSKYNEMIQQVKSWGQIPSFASNLIRIKSTLPPWSLAIRMRTAAPL